MKTYRLKIGEQSFEARILEYTESRVIVDLNGDTYEVELTPDESVERRSFVRSVPQATGNDSAGAAADTRSQPPTPEPRPTPQRPVSGVASPGALTAPIPGVVKDILVSEGDVVIEGQVVLILEAMKMENEIAARSSGTVTTIHVKVGNSVQEDQPLLDIGEA